MKCPRCNSQRIREEGYETTNKVRRGVHIFGAGVLGAAGIGIILLATPPLMPWGIASFSTACAIGNQMPNKEKKYIYKCKCEECGYKWKI